MNLEEDRRMVNALTWSERHGFPIVHHAQFIGETINPNSAI